MFSKNCFIPCFTGASHFAPVVMLFFAGIFSLSCAHAGGIFKCKSADGRTTMQDSPCAANEISTLMNNKYHGRNNVLAERRVGIAENSNKCKDLYAKAKNTQQCIDTIKAERFAVDRAGLIEVFFRNRHSIRKACEPDESELKTLHCTPEDGFYEVHSQDRWAGIPESPGSYTLVTIAGRRCHFIRQTINWQKCEEIYSLYR